jgi:4'-phosphopantetheinyl transferase
MLPQDPDTPEKVDPHPVSDDTKMIVSNQSATGWSDFRVDNTKVHVWHASLQQPVEVIQKLEAVLSEEERKRADRFRFAKDRQSFIVGRGILRNLLSRYTGIKPEEIQFKYNPAGKPFLANEEADPEICFNLSHAGQLVLYAFSWRGQVGIDVECIRPMEEMDQVAEINFSRAEYARFKKVSPQDRLRAFYNCWTRKEAFIKAIGDGMSFPLQEFEVSLEPDVPAQLLTVHGSSEGANHWTMHDLKTRDGYAAALVVEGIDHSICHKQWIYPETANGSVIKY